MTVANSRLSWSARRDPTARLVWFPTRSPRPTRRSCARGLGDRSGRGDLEQLSLLNRDGSTVEFGDLLMLPIGDSILWVRPLYVAAEGDASVPTLQRVIATVGEGERITIASNLTEALNQLFDGEDFSDLLGAVADPDPEPPSRTTDLSPATTRSRRRRRPPRGARRSRVAYDQRQEALTSSPPDRDPSGRVVGSDR